MTSRFGLFVLRVSGAGLKPNTKVQHLGVSFRLRGLGLRVDGSWT